MSVLLEGITLKSKNELVAYAIVIAEYYENSKSKIYNSVYWNSLRDSVNRLYPKVIGKLEVNTSPDDPYAGDVEMIGDIRQGKLTIYSDHTDHPILSNEDVVKFRTVHDYMAHGAANLKQDISKTGFKGGSFSYRGELSAYLKHAKLAPPDALPALFTEVIGQASYYCVTGIFPEQKIIHIVDADHTNIGNLSGQSKTRFDEILSLLNNGKTIASLLPLKVGQQVSKTFEPRNKLPLTGYLK